MAEQIKLSLDDQEKLLLHLAKRIEDIEQALTGVYSILGEDANHREKLVGFLKEKLKEDTNETSQSLISRFEQSQGVTETSHAALFDILQKALHSSIRLPSTRGLYDG